MEIHHVSRRKFASTILWAVTGSIVIVGVVASLGRATMNLRAAVTDKPDIAIYMLLPDEEIGKTTVLREVEDEVHYLAETKEGPKLIILKKGEIEWYVSKIEPLKE